MKLTNRTLLIPLLVISILVFNQCRSPKQLDEYYCNLMAGEPSQTTVILVARLHKTDTLVNNDLKGINGYIKFRITRDVNSGYFMESPFSPANENNDYTAKYQFTGLRPGQKYFYSISYGKDTLNNTSSPWGNFKTLLAAVSDKNTGFIVTNTINSETLFKSGNNNQILPKEYSVFSALSYFMPDFFIANGEILTQNGSEEDVRTKWHNLFSIPVFNSMVINIPGFWILPETSASLNKLFDQLPINPSDSQFKSLNRTYRLNRDVQIWILSGIYSDGNGSSLKNSALTVSPWLKKSLRESDSPFKLIITPDPVIGTDGNQDSENTAKNELMMTARDSLFTWLRNNGLWNNGLYFICNKPAEQYHSIDPTGFEEFSCGSLFETGIHNIISAPDSAGTALYNLIKLPYFQNATSGGFLVINSNRDEFNSPVLLFRFFDRDRKLLYAVNKF